MTTATIYHIDTDHDTYDPDPVTDEERGDIEAEAQRVIDAEYDAMRDLQAWHTAHEGRPAATVEEMAWESDILDLSSDGEAA